MEYRRTELLFMHQNEDEKNTSTALATVIEAIKTKKGNRILDIDISKQSTTLCRHFVICDAQSHVQVQAIADEVLEQMRETVDMRAYHKEGYQNGIWILLDFIDIVVHVFQSEARQFYNLEGLWGDGRVTRHGD